MPYNVDMEINFTKKMSALRPYGKPSAKAATPEAITNQLESDRGRIIQSASVRRLQQKTQVFPLERNAAVRSRLTHSLEVQQNGRYIVKTLMKKLQGREKVLGLEGLAGAVESLVEMACLMHDIGNPPFGHFGEAAINRWFGDNLANCEAWALVKDVSLRETLIKDLQSFEGNAQAIRLTYSLQQMNLTHAQTAAILKYTRGAFEEKSNGDQLSQLKKKPGFYWSERHAVKEMCRVLEMDSGHRHPLTYIMEAADDMAYCLADIEDAVEKGILKLPRLSKLIIKHFKKSGGKVKEKNILTLNNADGQGDKSIKEIVKEAKKASKDEVIDGNHQYFIKLRINLIHHLVNHAADRFIDNIEAVFNGEFNQALLEDDSVAKSIVQTFKSIGYQHVFNHKEVQTLELQGHQIITGLLGIYAKVLNLKSSEMPGLLSGRSKNLYEQLLFNRIDPKIIKAYQKAVKIENDELEFYYRCRMVQDHISAMTDHSAHDEYKTLMVAD